ncbi:MAG: hypothetical protein K0U98_25200 [Deltaproteobacteria bacterium]|nr:hypothetical protein [Deltaproteobacteria bacterium]
MPAPTNVERLTNVGILDANNVHDSHLDAINDLTDAEVDTLILIASKIGTPQAENDDDVVHPWCL